MFDGTRRLRSLLAILALPLAGACTPIVTTASYDEPMPYVSFAAAEALATAGFQVDPEAARSHFSSVTREILVGLFIGDGGSTIIVKLQPIGDSTLVTIRPGKVIFGGTGRYLDDLVAEYLATYIEQNRDLRDRIVAEAGESTR